MNRALHYYLLFGLAAFVGLAAMTAYQIIHAPFAGFQFCVDTNYYGEGIVEMILTIAAIPAMLILLFKLGRRIWTKEKWL